MSLRNIAAQDLQSIMSSECGATWPVTLIAPDGQEWVDVPSRHNDIARIVDPDTGQVVSGREVTTVISTLELQERGAPIPQGVYDENQKPWLIRALNISQEQETFKIFSSEPDQALGAVVLVLEKYDD